MIVITRNLARQLRAVFRRLEPRAMHTNVSFTAGAGGLRVRVHQTEILAEYHQAGELPADQIVLPLEVLADFEGKNEQTVTIETTSLGNVQARWDDCGVPQTKDYEAVDPAKLPEFPVCPEALEANDPGLLGAFADGTRTAGKDNIRYAVNHLLLRGGAGTIAATDGRQLLTQSGYRIPWKEDVLVPASPVFSCKELAQHEAVSIGKTEAHVALVVGPWTLFLPISKERFPHIDEIIPRQAKVKSHGWLDAGDGAFLAKVLPRLPGSEDEDAPVTVDLNDKVFVRARASSKGTITEVVLDRSTQANHPVRFALNRCYLARAVQLGLSEIHVVDASTPVIFKDEKRQFVVMPLGKNGAIAPSDDAVRISSAASPSNNHHQSPKRRITTLNEPQTNGSQNGHADATTNGAANNGTASNGVRRRKGKTTGLAALIEEAEALKKALRDAYGRSHLLLRDIKRQRKQSSVMQTALRTLKELQSVDR